MYDIKNLVPNTTINIVYDTDALLKDSGLTVQGTCSYEYASQYKDVAAMHNNIYSGLAAKPEKDPAKLQYVIVKRSSGETDYIADAWIRNVEKVQGIRLRMTLEVETMEDVETIKRWMASKGYDGIEWDFIEQ